MRRMRHLQNNESRRGIILLVVLALLTLFLVVGLSFVSYADSELEASRNQRDGGNAVVPDFDPELALAEILGQLNYGVIDDESGVWSSLRGHDFARSMYGFYYEIGNNQTNIFPGFPGVANVNKVVPGLNSTPYNGTGRLHNSPVPSALGAVDEYELVNYMYFQSLDGGPLHDPERLLWRAGLRQAGAPVPRGLFTGGFNAPYTYADENNMFLAAVDNQGNVLAPSFHRDFTGFGTLDPNNPNWLVPSSVNPALKYMVLRPRPADHLPMNGKPGFPLPDDAGGDVKNLVGGPSTVIGGKKFDNDSIWIDIGAPVLKLPDGRKYKMLVAPLIVDLDGRINLNVHGNVRGQNLTNASNQGWGKWEVNPGLVLSTNPVEYQNLFVGNPTTGLRGRYGVDKSPSSAGFSAPAGKPAPFYSVGDIDGTNEANGFAPTLSLLLPQFPVSGTNSPLYGTVTPNVCFPPFPIGYSGGSTAELQNHPALYNYFFPQGDDRVFGASHMEAILRYGGTNSPALKSDLYSLLPVNMADPAIRARVTSISMDQDRPGISPYIWDPADPNRKYTWTNPGPTTYPKGNAYSLSSVLSTPPGRGAPPPAPPPTPPPAGSDFDPFTWRAEPTTFRGIANVLRRLNLDRNLTDFPPSAAGAIPSNAQTAQALADRQFFANDIFNALLAVTGAQTPTAALQASDPNAFNAARWLAQLAVNIVDFIDNDDYSTPFPWFPWTPPGSVPAAGQQWVFGTELPRIVMNESFIEYDNIATDKSPNPTGYNVNVWVELHNTSRSQNDATNGNYNPTPYPAVSDDGKAYLQVGTNAVYQIVLCNQTATAIANLANPANSMGDPDFGGSTTVQNTPATWNWATAQSQVVQPAYGQYTSPNQIDQGFYVVGPQTTYNAAGLGDPKLPNTFLSPNMTYVEKNTLRPLKSPLVLLRRLAIPSLPANPVKADGTLTTAGQPANPYITIDYLYDDPIPHGTNPQRDAEVNDGLAFDATGVVPPTPMNARASWGRKQPYTAAAFNRKAQLISVNPTDPPQHTLFRHNSRIASLPTPAQYATEKNWITLPFDWPAQLDRQLISPMELLNVSGFRPHELTQQFMTGPAAAQRFQHRAPWFDQDARIYRLFELLENSDKAASCTVGGRLPGKININTIWPDNVTAGSASSSIFRALCDPQVSNNFTQARIDLMFSNTNLTLGPPGIMQYRTPGSIPQAGDHPFIGMAAAPGNGDLQYPAGNGISRTLLTQAVLTPTLTNPSVLQVPIPASSVDDPQFYHPYQQDALLSKIFSNVTTRSNVFAVFMTVGFFEVNDDTKRPVSLGAELGRTENRHVRHRMFAIVDRTAMTWFSFNTQSAVTFTANGGVFPTSVTTTFTLPALVSKIDRRTGRQWTIVPGMMLNVDYGRTSTDPATGQTVYAEENVIVEKVVGNTITATFTKQHNPGMLIRCFGNPGPWLRYDPRQDNQVVPYFSIID